MYSQSSSSSLASKVSILPFSFFVPSSREMEKKYNPLSLSLLNRKPVNFEKITLSSHASHVYMLFLLVSRRFEPKKHEICLLFHRLPFTDSLFCDGFLNPCYFEADSISFCDIKRKSQCLQTHQKEVYRSLGIYFKVNAMM